MRGQVTILLVLLGPAASVPATAAPGGSTPPALVIEQGSLARAQVVALGRNLVVAGAAHSDVAAINGSMEISGSVGGDAIVLGGDARVLSGGVVRGDVFVLGGKFEAEDGARIGGRTVAYPSVSSAWLTLLEGPSVGFPAASPLVVAAKLALLAAWSLLTLVLFVTSGREVLSTSAGVRREPFRNFFTGLIAVLAMTLTALLLSAFTGAVVGVPLLVLVVLLALLLKLWGMVAVFHAAGDWIARRLGRHSPPLTAAAIGLLVLGGIKLLPWLGVWIWTIATLIGVGSSLTTKFGRRQPWFPAAEEIDAPFLDPSGSIP